MNMRLLFLAAWLPALVSLTSCGGSSADADGDHTAIPFVEASEATRAPAALTVPARVRSEKTAQLATRASGTIRRILVDVGDVVREGQDLVLLKDADVRAGVARAEANLELARRTRDRIAALERDGAATGQELDEATARLQVAEAGLTESRSGLQYAVLRAPFGGVVSARHADPGDLAVPGRSILEVSGAGDLVVEADLSARLSVQQGQQVSIEQSAGLNGRWVAEITRVVPVLDQASQTFRIEARLVPTDGPLPVPNSIVGLHIPSESDSVLVVPADAMFSRGQLTGVFLVRGTGLRLRWIRPGREWGSSREVLSGLAPGDTVVRRPDAALIDGQIVDSVTVVRWSDQQDGVQ